MNSRLFVSVGAILAAISSTAFGAEEKLSDAVEEIIVTATKRDSTLLSVTAPISVISGERIFERGVSDFDSLVEQIPGVSLTSDYGGASSKVISIRGVGATDDYRPNGSSSVAMHVDGIYQASNVFLTMPFFDVARVEVLKGPQGTLYGRNSTAGVVNLITRSDSTALNGYLTTQYESFDRVRVEGAVGLPLSDTVGLRLAASIDQGGGFQDGKGAGRFAGRVYIPAVGGIPDPGTQNGFGDRDLYAGRATLSVDFSEQTQLIAKLFASSDKGEPQQPDSRGGVNNGGWIESDDDPYSFYSDRYPRKDIDLWGVSAALKHSLSERLRFDLNAGYQRGDRYVEGEGTGSPQRNFDFNFSDSIEQSSVEARLSTQENGAVDWVLGLFHIRDEVDFATDLIALDVFGSTLLSDYHQTRTSNAAFGQVDWHLAERFTLSTGLRYTKDEVTYTGATTDQNPLGASLVPIALPAIPVIFDNDFDDDDVSGRVTLAYQPNPMLNTYVSVGTGYKAGGFDGSTIFSVPEALPFKSEDVLAYEGGVKFAGTHGLTLNADAFYYDFDDLQANTTTIVAGQATAANVRTNVAKARLYGVDVGFGVTLLDLGTHTVALDGGATWIDSEILEFDSSNPAIVAVNTGNELPAAPKLSANAQLRYTYAGGAGWDLSATLNGRHKSDEYKRLDNSAGSYVPSYTLLDARLELHLLERRLRLFTYARNLTDETYYVDRSAAARVTGSPRVYGAGIRADF